MDYEKINFRCGLECHQRLETHKLFCNCPSNLRDDKPDIIIKRRLRAIPGETGKIDEAALYEMKKNLEFLYEGYSDTTCLVEFDEEPIKSLNQEALETALQVSLLLNAKIVDEIQVMRKIVIDGSNTSGFQRTALIARDGHINTSLGKVEIGYIFLEEEAAKNIKEQKHQRIFRLDRLGIPLIEIQTKPDIKTPGHAKEVAEKIGMILRSTGKIMHGIGSIRQDINLSVKNYERVEIKGFQDLRSIPNIIEYETGRLLKLIDQGKGVKAEVRKANPDNTTSFLRPMPGAARLYPETDIPIIKITKEMLSSIKLPELLTEKAIKLEKMYNLNPDLAKAVLKKKIELEKFVDKFRNIEPSFIAHTLIELPKEIRRRYKLDVNKIKMVDFENVLDYLNDNKITKDAVFELLVDIASSKKIDISRYRKISAEEIEEDIKRIIEKNRGASFNAIMGEIMKAYKGKIEGRKIAEILKKNL